MCFGLKLESHFLEPFKFGKYWAPDIFSYIVFPALKAQKHILTLLGGKFNSESYRREKRLFQIIPLSKWWAKLFSVKFWA